MFRICGGEIFWHCQWFHQFITWKEVLNKLLITLRRHFQMFEGKCMCSLPAFMSIESWGAAVACLVCWPLGERVSAERVRGTALVLTQCALPLCKGVHACSHLLTPAHTWATGKDFQGVHHSGMVSIFSPWCKIRLNFKSELDSKILLERLPNQLLNMAHVSSCSGPIILCSTVHQTNKEGGFVL